MTADPKNPNNDPGQAEGSDERYEAVETTLAVASDDPVDVELTGEALKEDGDAENAPGTTREQASGSGSRALTLFLVVVLSLAAAAVGAALGPRILPQESDSGLASLQTQLSALQSEVASLKSASGQDAALTARMDTLETKLGSLDDLQARLSDAELAVAALAAEAPDADTQRLDALAARVDSLEAAPAVVPQSGDNATTSEPVTSVEMAELRDRARALIERIEALPQGSFATLDGLDARLAALEAAMQANAAALGQVSTVDTAVGALGDQLASLQADLDALEKRAVDPGSAFVLATGQLREAVAIGNAYRDRLEAASALAPDDAVAASSLQTLSSHADKGIATTRSLGARLPDAISDAVTAERVATSDGILDQTLARLEGLVSIRRVDGQAEGADADAVTSRAEALFNAGNLDAALKELEGLSDEAAGAMSDWIEDARAHLDAQAALDDLHDRAIALVGGTVN